MKGQNVVLAKGSDFWGTPLSIFEPYHQEFRFTIDASADATNHLLSRWWGPGSTLGEDALTASWVGETCWLNPPYSRIRAFTEKARYEQIINGVTTVMLIPSRTDTRYWHDYIWDRSCSTWHQGIEGRFHKGRIKFWKTDEPDKQTQTAPFPSVFVIFRGHRRISL